MSTIPSPLEGAEDLFEPQPVRTVNEVMADPHLRRGRTLEEVMVDLAQPYYPQGDSPADLEGREFSSMTGPELAQAIGQCAQILATAQGRLVEAEALGAAARSDVVDAERAYEAARRAFESHLPSIRVPHPNDAAIFGTKQTSKPAVMIRHQPCGEMVDLNGSHDCRYLVFPQAQDPDCGHWVNKGIRCMQVACERARGATDG